MGSMSGPTWQASQGRAMWAPTRSNPPEIAAWSKVAGRKALVVWQSRHVVGKPGWARAWSSAWHEAQSSGPAGGPGIEKPGPLWHVSQATATWAPRRGKPVAEGWSEAAPSHVPGGGRRGRAVGGEAGAGGVHEGGGRARGVVLVAGGAVVLAGGGEEGVGAAGGVAGRALEDGVGAEEGESARDRSVVEDGAGAEREGVVAGVAGGGEAGGGVVDDAVGRGVEVVDVAAE